MIIRSLINENKNDYPKGPTKTFIESLNKHFVGRSPDG